MKFTQFMRIKRLNLIEKGNSIQSHTNNNREKKTQQSVNIFSFLVFIFYIFLEKYVSFVEMRKKKQIFFRSVTVLFSFVSTSVITVRLVNVFPQSVNWF